MINLETGLNLELSKNDYTAAVIYSPDVNEDILIPRSINYESHEYLITSIAKDSFASLNFLKSIDFPEDSEMRLFCKGSFSRSGLEKLKIPSKLEKLEDGWCKNTHELTQLILSPSNKNFKILDNSLLIGKSNTNENEFDSIYFAKRNIKKAVIPSNIKYIMSYSFANCEMFTKIDIPENSELLSIQKKAFFGSCLNNLYIPKNFKTFHEGWCHDASSLTLISISPKNENFIYLNEQLILGKNDQNKVNYDELYFARRDIEKVNIPSYIKKIDSHSFYLCLSLDEVKFSEDSELESIGKSSFFGTSIEKIIIPNRVKEIGLNCFSECDHIKEIQFNENSELLCFEEKIFAKSSIEKVNIPKNVIELKNDWNYITPKLNNIIVSPFNDRFKTINDKMLIEKSDPTIDYYDTISFACRDIENVIIPSYIKYIGSNAFFNCSKLKSIEFEENSELKMIGSFAFSDSTIKRISIPSHVDQIGSFAFSWCYDLKRVEFDKESELFEIDESAFSNAGIQSFLMPKKVTEIKTSTFLGCQSILSFGFSNDNDIEIIGNNAFSTTTIRAISIPKKVKEIGIGAFNNCLLKKICFEDNSELSLIRKNAFAHCLLRKIIVPPLVSLVEEKAFSFCPFLRMIEFQSFDLTIDDFCFADSKRLFVISFPNAKRIVFQKDALVKLSKMTSIMVSTDVNIVFNND